MRRTSHHHHSNYQHLGKFMSYSSSNTRNPVSEQSKFHILHLETIRLCVWCLYRKGRKGGWGLINGQVSNSHVDRLIHLTTHSPADLLSTPISPFFFFFSSAEILNLLLQSAHSQFRICLCACKQELCLTNTCSCTPCIVALTGNEKIIIFCVCIYIHIHLHSYHILGTSLLVMINGIHTH